MSKPNQKENPKPNEGKGDLQHGHLSLSGDQDLIDESSIATFEELLRTPRASTLSISEQLETMTRLEAVKQLFIYLYLTLIHLYQGPIEKSKRKPKESSVLTEESFLASVDCQFCDQIDKIIDSVPDNPQLNGIDNKELTAALLKINRFFYSPTIRSGFYTDPFDISTPNSVDSKKRPVAMILQEDRLSMDYFKNYQEFVEERFRMLSQKKKEEISRTRLVELLNSSHRVLILQEYYLYAMMRLRKKLGDFMLPSFFEQVEEWRELKDSGRDFKNSSRGSMLDTHDDFLQKVYEE